MKNVLRRKLYKIWWRMKDRCYNPNSKEYKYYGAKGVEVSREFLEFESFIENISKVDGYNEYLKSGYKLHLDKDLKGFNPIYSVKNCKFITHEENNKYKPNQMKSIIGISPSNEIFVFFNQSEFAREHKLRQSSISDCLSGRIKTHRKWKFKYKEEV